MKETQSTTVTERDTAGSAVERVAPASRPMKVFLMDLWCIVPYYTGYLGRALLDQGVDVTLGSISYHFDVECFARSGLKNDPGLLDIVGRLQIKSAFLRRALKAIESCMNLAALSVRFLFSRPDILHVQFIPLVEQGLPIEVWFLKYAKRLGCKLVYTVHNELPLDSGEKYKNTFAGIYRLMDALICHTNEAKLRVAREYSIACDRVHVIPHGPLFHDARQYDSKDARAKLGIPQEECVVLWQGWIKPYKGVLFLLDAWRRVQEQDSTSRLIIAGSGEEQLLREIQQKVAALGIANSVRLELRFVDANELPLYYSAADILVYPYKEITTSGALMTGLNYGKAIVATDLPAFREVLADGKTASLVGYGDMKALADALLGLMKDPDLRGQLGRKAASLSTTLPNSWATIAAETVDCYRRVLASQLGREAIAVGGSNEITNAGRN
jgi:glycosyltransferase involved in cell wall biosynthesis